MVKRVDRLSDFVKRFGKDKNVKILSYSGNVLNYDYDKVENNKCVGLLTLEKFLETKTRNGYTYHNEIVYSVVVNSDNYVLLKLERFNGYHNYQDVNDRR